MTRLRANLRLDFRRAFLSYGFMVAVAGMTASLFLNISTEALMLSESYADVLYFFTVSQFHSFSLLSLVFAVLPYSTAFCVDWSNQFIRFHVTRTSISSYGVSKVIASALAGGSAVALGQIIFIVLLRLRLPLVNMYGPMLENATSEAVFGGLVAEGQIVMYFVLKVLISFLAAAFFAVLAMAISTYITNVFVTLASPVLAYYFLIQALGGAGTDWLNLHSILLGKAVGGNAYLSVCYSMLAISVLCAGMGIIIVYQIERRLEHG